jgi:hypothetical protein
MKSEVGMFLSSRFKGNPGWVSSKTPKRRHGDLHIGLLGSLVCLFFGCVDLTEPWNSGGQGGRAGQGRGGANAGGALVDAEVVEVDGQAQGGTDAIEVSGTGGIVDAATGGSGGAGGTGGGPDSASGGAGGSMDVAVGGAGGSPDVATGTGGKGSGGTTIPKDAGQGGTGAGGSGAGGALPQDVGTATGGSTSIPDASSPDVVEAGADTPVISIPTEGLVAYYPCEQASSGGLPDLSGKNYPGKLEGSGYTFEAGKVGKALSLSKAGSHVSLPPAVFSGKKDLTVATWIKLTTLTTWQRVFDFGINANLSQNTASGTIYMTLVLKNFDNRMAFSATTNGYGSEKQLTGATPAVGVWKHMTVVLASGTGYLYVDGVQASSNNVGQPADLGAVDYAFIGKSQFSGDPLIDAQFDEFRVYDRALTDAEIQALYNYAGP